MHNISVKWIISSLFIVIYACSVMWILLDVRLQHLSSKRRLFGGLMFITILLITVVVPISFGLSFYSQYYIVFAQLPVCLLFGILTNYHIVKLFFVLLTAVFLSSPVMSILIISRQFLLPPLLISVFSYLVIGFFVYHFLKKPFNYMLQFAENRIFILFSTIPLLYYIYNFARTRYQFTNVVVDRQYFILQLPLLMVLVSYILLVRIFEMVSEKHALQNTQTIVAMQLDAATEQIEQLRDTQKQAAIYRHDIRHHLNYLGICIAQDKLQDALAYIAETCEKMDATKVVQYSENESVNLVVSAYATEAEANQIAIDITITTSHFSRFPISDLCSLFSNALENAIHACTQIADPQKRYITFSLYEKSNKLCIDVRNSYQLEPIFARGLPITIEKAHGIGTKSMAYVVEKNKGIYRFSAQNGIFMFQATM